MLTGRKLLLADDSAAVRKVIELTFTDEGMEVVTVGDGRSALERFEQIAPDLVLADVYMPEIGGYELCRSIKQDERFSKTPVVLLISSFEPFDESEARRAGADDVVTKPFQSIRQLVSRVGSLLQKGADESQMTNQYSTLGIDHDEPVVPAPREEIAIEPPVTVLVEAPVMEHSEPAERPGVTCSTDIELQTADTMKLDRIADEPFAETTADELIQDTIEVEPIAVEPMAVESNEAQSAQIEEPAQKYAAVAAMNEPIIQSPARSTAPRSFDDAVLDLEDENLGAPQVLADDVFLDLDFDDGTTVEAKSAPSEEQPPAQVLNHAVEPETHFEPAPIMAVTEFEPAPEASPVQSFPTGAAEEALTTEVNGLSPAAIDAIARRMVAQMSDKVVREIAWEVVPEMSELLIKQKLNEPK